MKKKKRKQEQKRELKKNVENMRKIILKGGELGRERGKGEEEFEEATKKESTRKWRKERQSRRLQ